MINWGKNELACHGNIIPKPSRVEFGETTLGACKVPSGTGKERQEKGTTKIKNGFI